MTSRKAVYSPLPFNHNPLEEPMLRKKQVSSHTLFNAHATSLTCCLFCYIALCSLF